MRGKELDFAELYDVRAFRVIVADIKDCYTVLGIVHNLWQPVPREFDDYISRPKPNGYKSLHTVVIGDDGRAFEVQIRTQEMHQFAEYGVAAHWRYKEAGTRGYGGQFAANEKYDEKIAWLRQLLAWKDDVSEGEHGEQRAAQPWEQLRAGHARRRPHLRADAAGARDRAAARRDARRFRLSPAQRAGTSLPRRARRRRDGAAQHAVAKRSDGRDRRGEGGRAVARLAQPATRLSAQSARAAEGARVVQRGRSCRNISRAAARWSKRPCSAKARRRSISISWRPSSASRRPTICSRWSARKNSACGIVEQALHDAPPPEPVVEAPEQFEKRSSGASVARGASTGVLVVGVDALLTQLARCCRPAPPDDICGFVTRGKGMSIHRSDCPTFQRMADARARARVADGVVGGGDERPRPVGVSGRSRRSRRRTGRVCCAISPKCSRAKRST